jgi:nicotinamide-nucleotide amidase
VTDLAPLAAAAARLVETCTAQGLTVVTAESCTGGMVAAAMTEIPGASAVLLGGFVAYADAAKTAMLGVPAGVIAREGAVSEAVARAMAVGALAHGDADLAVAVTGIAGPGGGSDDKPVGLVHLAAARRGGAVVHRRFLFGGRDRAGVRLAASAAALALLTSLI